MPKHIHQMANTVCCKQKYGNLNAWACSTFFCTSVSAVPSCYENKNPITSTEEVQSCPKSELQVIIIIIIHPKENTDRKNIHDVDRWMVYQESTKENTARKKIHTVDRWMVYQESTKENTARKKIHTVDRWMVYQESTKENTARKKSIQ